MKKRCRKVPIRKLWEYFLLLEPSSTVEARNIQNKTPKPLRENSYGEEDENGYIFHVWKIFGRGH